MPLVPVLHGFRVRVGDFWCRAEGFRFPGPCSPKPFRHSNSRGEAFRAQGPVYPILPKEYFSAHLSTLPPPPLL